MLASCAFISGFHVIYILLDQIDYLQLENLTTFYKKEGHDTIAGPYGDKFLTISLLLLYILLGIKNLYTYHLQIRSHAQMYFLKVRKSGTSEHVPPPRPKRKAAHPSLSTESPKRLLIKSYPLFVRRLVVLLK